MLDLQETCKAEQAAIDEKRVQKRGLLAKAYSDAKDEAKRKYDDAVVRKAKIVEELRGIDPTCLAVKLDEFEKTCQPGQVITFGRYPQRGEEKQPLEWSVLTREGNSLMLITKKTIECMQYNQWGSHATWDACYIRTWLNGTFLRTAFDLSERAIIRETEIYPESGIAAYYDDEKIMYRKGKKTKDRVFLLSCKEAEELFVPLYRNSWSKLEDDITLNASRYKKKNMEYVWPCILLRSTVEGEYPSSAMHIHTIALSPGDDLVSHGGFPPYEDFFIRPVVWIDLNKVKSWCFG